MLWKRGFWKYREKQRKFCLPALICVPQYFQTLLLFGYAVMLLYNCKASACWKLHWNWGKADFLHQRCFIPFLNKPWFLRICSTNLFKTLWEKEKLLVMSNFSFSHSAFYQFGELSFVKFKIVVCKLFQYWRVQNLLFGKGLKIMLK